MTGIRDSLGNRKGLFWCSPDPADHNHDVSQVRKLIEDPYLGELCSSPDIGLWTIGVIHEDLEVSEDHRLGYLLWKLDRELRGLGMWDEAWDYRHE